jgi:hypothetical protein
MEVAIAGFTVTCVALAWKLGCLGLGIDSLIVVETRVSIVRCAVATTNRWRAESVGAKSFIIPLGRKFSVRATIFWSENV